MNKYYNFMHVIGIMIPDVGAAENAAAAAWGSISLGGGGVSAAGTHFLAT